MKRMREILKDKRGVTLIELLVVVAILGILATLTAVAVTGTTGKTKGAGKSNDQVTVKNALSSYGGEQPQGRSATLDGCLPALSGNLGLKNLTLTCDAPSGIALTGTGSAMQGFFVSEAAVAVDIDGDGDTDSSELVAPIIWGQNFTGDDGTVRTFNIDFIDIPKHAFDLIGTPDGWKTTTGDRPEDGLTLIAPFVNTGDPTNTDFCPGDLNKCPVWVLTEGGDAVALITSSSY